MLTVCGLLLCLVAASHQLSINEFVVPQSAEVGSDVELRCGYSLDASDGQNISYVKWWWYGTNDRRQLYQRVVGGDMEAARGVVILGDKDDIKVKHVNYTDSGIYECEVNGENEKRVHAGLIVFSNGTGPQLNISVVGDGADEDTEDDLLLDCYAYDVTPQPELVLSANGRPVDGVIQYVRKSSEELFNVKVNATVTKADLEVKCELFFVNHNITHLPFVDAETYSTGAATTTAEPALTPANITQLENSPTPQINHSGSKNLSWWVSIVAVLVPLYLRTLL